MKNNVRIRILSRQRKNGESDEMEICTEGTFLCKKGVYYLFYTEYTETLLCTLTQSAQWINILMMLKR